jgi:hypothetical protein
MNRLSNNIKAGEVAMQLLGSQARYLKILGQSYDPTYTRCALSPKSTPKT